MREAEVMLASIVEGLVSSAENRRAYDAAAIFRLLYYPPNEVIPADAESVEPR
jgi:hypothetical protein